MLLPAGGQQDVMGDAAFKIQTGQLLFLALYQPFLSYLSNPFIWILASFGFVENFSWQLSYTSSHISNLSRHKPHIDSGNNPDLSRYCLGNYLYTYSNNPNLSRYNPYIWLEIVYALINLGMIRICLGIIRICLGIILGGGVRTMLNMLISDNYNNIDPVGWMDEWMDWWRAGGREGLNDGIKREGGRERQENW